MRNRSVMSASRLVAEADRVREIVGLNQRAEVLIPKTERGQRALVFLVTQSRQLLGLRRRLMEAALVELLWQYQDFVEGSDTGYVVRQLIADIGTRG
ncbi:hypothetical protein FJY68_10665 [candidate division WOR-3 bacterium]|uniref:Uncharacterized protein n=1 Tax=candidate division WOR-3 bacterium TaxID=2052148 RepID=A0A937XIF8_UNCW3|nr:hypothetical protein [candidate division WOR-3 bacterium]